MLTDTVGRGYKNPRPRRGILNFVGEISEVLFGTLDENDVVYYDEQIRRFERNSDNTDLLKQQVYVIKFRRQRVKSTLEALNDTLVEVEHKASEEGLCSME
jgi:hypothetical protein